MLCRCIWHLKENLVKNLRGIMGSDWGSFQKHFYGAAFASTEAAMELKWQLMIQVLRFAHNVCGLCLSSVTVSLTCLFGVLLLPPAIEHCLTEHMKQGTATRLLTCLSPLCHGFNLAAIFVTCASQIARAHDSRRRLNPYMPEAVDSTHAHAAAASGSADYAHLAMVEKELDND